MLGPKSNYGPLRQERVAESPIIPHFSPSRHLVRSLARHVRLVSDFKYIIVFDRAE